MNFTPEMIEKAKTAATPDELLAMAKEAGMDDFTADEAGSYFAQLHPAEGELSDDELDNVSGGGCYNGGELVVTVGTRWCDKYECKYCRKTKTEIESRGWVDTIGLTHYCKGKSVSPVNACGSCYFCSHDGALWKCTNPKKKKR